MNLNTNCNHIK